MHAYSPYENSRWGISHHWAGSGPPGLPEYPEARVEVGKGCGEGQAPALVTLHAATERRPLGELCKSV